ncbi:MAG TPA: S-layer homology domain-containing protein [Clostridia bacterium]|nr:S-layer homology domain-containing protein [Clostridia bacterium]
MKKFTIAAIFIYTLCIFAYAAPGYEPGISGDITPKKGELKYSETVFLSGEPIILEGIIKISGDNKGTKTTLEYKLANTQKAAALTRKVTFLNSTSSDVLENQSTYSTSIDPKFSETIQIGSNTFEMKEYLFSRSGNTDGRDVIRYLNSDWNGRKVYLRNGDQGEIVVDINSHLYGYNNYWSSTETAIIKHSVTYRYKDAVSASVYKEAFGTVEYAVSNSSVKAIQYVSSGPQDISFAGGYILKEGEENIVSYVFDVPKLNAGIPTTARNKGKNSYKLVTMPVQTRLLSNNIKDISASYWAAEDIKRVTSLGIISMSGADYYRPLSFMSRGEFAKAIVKVSDMNGPMVKQTKPVAFEQYYTDVDKNHPYYEYISKIASSGAMEGISKNRFGPDEYLTKAQAAAIIVRALGLENSSTESGTATSFKDDASVQLWAKKPINIAHRMGIITGNADNEIEPNKMLTRAECAAMINRFIRYLQYDIRQGYREDMINFGR